VPYFHVVFTLPSELRRLVRQHQRVLIAILFQAAFESLSTLCADPQWLGGHVGALAVLHTWTRTLEWHPHVHLLVPGGGLTPDRNAWLGLPQRPKNYLVPERALAKRFRGRFLALARKALPSVPVPEIPWGKRWVVFTKEVVQDPARILEYLGRYVHRTALSDKAILRYDDRSVTFRYRDSRSHEPKTMTLDAYEFLRRFLQHVSPRGMHRVRAFGLLHPSKRETLRQLQLLLTPSSATQTQAVDEPTPPDHLPRRARRCPHCGTGILRWVRALSAEERWALLTTSVMPPLPEGIARAPPRRDLPLVHASAA
jgi:hypothetical protein